MCIYTYDIANCLVGYERYRLGLQDDLSLTCDQREEQWKPSGKIYKTNNFTQSAEGHKDGLWTIVLSAAVYTFPSDLALVF